MATIKDALGKDVIGKRVKIIREMTLEEKRTMLSSSSAHRRVLWCKTEEGKVLWKFAKNIEMEEEELVEKT